MSKTIHDMMLDGRGVSVSNIDRSDGITLTVTIDGQTVRLDLDQPEERADLAARFGFAPEAVGRLWQWAHDLDAPSDPDPGQAAPLPAVAPFPFEVLPPVVRSYCEAAARWLGADIPPEMIAGPLLAMVGALIGKRLGIAAKGSWVEYPGLFVAIVAKPGSAKSAAINLVHKPIARLQAEARE